MSKVMNFDQFEIIFHKNPSGMKLNNSLKDSACLHGRKPCAPATVCAFEFFEFEFFTL